jgi:hypothetical protein
MIGRFFTEEQKFTLLHPGKLRQDSSTVCVVRDNNGIVRQFRFDGFQFSPFIVRRMITVGDEQVYSGNPAQ